MDEGGGDLGTGSASPVAGWLVLESPA